MQCEVCGRHISGKPYKAIIEGARLVVCGGCAKLGSISWELETPKTTTPNVKAPKSPAPRTKTAIKPQSPLEPTLELVEDFGTRIRQAREAQGSTHEDLGRRISEKVSVLKKLESQKLAPDNKLAEKLQYALKIKLLDPVKKEKLPKGFLTAAPSKTITLGDLIKSEEE
ncbi:MAG: multiprotein bridging factor aMBF1 [Candidatus Bathyarchaeia archaeon]